MKPCIVLKVSLKYTNTVGDFGKLTDILLKALKDRLMTKNVVCFSYCCSDVPMFHLFYWYFSNTLNLLMGVPCCYNDRLRRLLRSSVNQWQQVLRGKSWLHSQGYLQQCRFVNHHFFPPIFNLN